MHKEFQVHKLNEKGMAQAEQLAGQFASLLGFCQVIGEPGRELLIVATKLEEACFFAKKALAIKKENQE